MCDSDKAYKETITKLNDLQDQINKLIELNTKIESEKQSELSEYEKERLNYEQDRLNYEKTRLEKEKTKLDELENKYKDLEARISNLENNCNLTIETDKSKTTVTYKHGLLDEILFSICIGVFIVIAISCIFIAKSEFDTKHLITFACIFVSLAALCIALFFCRRSEQQCMQKNINNLLVMSEYEATLKKLPEQNNTTIVTQNSQSTGNNTVHFDNENTVVELFRAYTNTIQRD